MVTPLAERVDRRGGDKRAPWPQRGVQAGVRGSGRGVARGVADPRGRPFSGPGSGEADRADRPSPTRPRRSSPHGPGAG